MRQDQENSLMHLFMIGMIGAMGAMFISQIYLLTVIAVIQKDIAYIQKAGENSYTLEQSKSDKVIQSLTDLAQDSKIERCFYKIEKLTKDK